MTYLECLGLCTRGALYVHRAVAPLLATRAESTCTARSSLAFSSVLDLYGHPRADVPDRCPSETFQSEDTYEPDASLSVRPYCAERLKLTKTDRPAVALEGLVGSDASPFLLDPVGTILKSDSELDGVDEVPKPYTDPNY